MAKKFGVNLDKATIELMTKSCKERKLAAPKDADAGTLAGLLVTHFRKAVAEDKLCQCGECGGVFDAEIEECPYCGDKEEAEEEAVAKPVAEKKAMDPELAKASKIADEVLKKPVVAAIVKAQAGELASYTTGDLDLAVTEIIRLKGSSAQSMWDLGANLKDVHEKQLWKLRMGPDGKPVYRTFEAFCLAEIKMSGTACYNMIDVVAKFSQEQIKEIGHTKLVLALRAPEEDRAEILKTAKEKSTRELQSKVKKLRAQKGAPTDGRVAKPGNAGTAPPKGVGRQSEHLTIVQILGKKTVRLFKKPSASAKAGAASVPAKKLADMPYGIYDLPNGVRMLFMIGVDDKGQLFLKIDTKRVMEQDA